jgi:uncharacterized protein (DUF1697 family)
MKTCIALFRGINVGGRHSLPMKELVALLESLGCRNVRTYIQSGNVVFQSSEKDTGTLAKQISAEIKRRRGFEPAVQLLTVKEFEKAMRQNPFPKAVADPKSLHLSFLAEKPKSPNLKRLEELRKDSEQYRLIGRVFYLHAPEGIGRSERCLGVPLTDRNWRTVCEIMKLAQS